uniref:Uncharacterized protein n=1 Tax=Siphoviridae sp. ctLqe90 TaxID=2825456 RepID=A0A8S5Q1Z5_9CAUD|nr:MAG TPA: hypothetical protein [Siphoviridae sp. ctLqe90]DAG36160.1 MAG TPA: hypothetical protein [Caudoviricetes sp.]DAH29767.1 MAG TPA: hypothetical protein [Caudoviricetes sp.]DAO37934.1 MAG TPA: hypothetical protein [Caudoviricetes sp.]
MHEIASKNVQDILHDGFRRYCEINIINICYL